MINPSTTFFVVLCYERGLDKRLLGEVTALFERHPGPVTLRMSNKTHQVLLDVLRVVSKPLELKKDGLGESLLWQDVFDSIEGLRETEQIPRDTFICLLTKTRNIFNWYAVQDLENMRSGFSHVGDFSWVTSAPNYAISAHYVLKGIFNALLQEVGIDWTILRHSPPRGCFYDFCENKADLNLKLRTADICGDCLPIFEAIDIPNALLAQTLSIMEETRRLALNTSQFLPAIEDFQDWPFPVAITRHKAVQAVNPLLRFMLLLDHFDSLVRYFYLAHEIMADRVPELVAQPSLGWWVDKLAHCLKGEKNFREVVTIAQQANVVKLRNEKRGHGWMSMSVESYREDAEKLEKVLERIEGELCPFLQKYRLVIPRQLELRSGVMSVEGEQLVGSHMIHPPFRVSVDDDLRKTGLCDLNKVYLTDRKMEQFKLVSPYIRHEMCPTCEHPRVLITDGGDTYIDVFMGHRVDFPVKVKEEKGK